MSDRIFQTLQSTERSQLLSGFCNRRSDRTVH